MERKKVLCRVASWPNLITAASSCSPSRTAACRVAPDGHQPLAHARDRHVPLLARLSPLHLATRSTCSQRRSAIGSSSASDAASLLKVTS